MRKVGIIPEGVDVVEDMILGKYLKIRSISEVLNKELGDSVVKSNN